MSVLDVNGTSLRVVHTLAGKIVHNAGGVFLSCCRYVADTGGLSISHRKLRNKVFSFECKCNNFFDDITTGIFNFIFIHYVCCFLCIDLRGRIFISIFCKQQLYIISCQ